MEPVSHCAHDFARSRPAPPAALLREGGTVAKYFGKLKKVAVPENFRTACNALKSHAIEKAVNLTKKRGVSVLDIGSGRGGDLLKWARHRPQKYIGCDASSDSVLEARTRHAALTATGKSFVPSQFEVVDVSTGIIPLDEHTVNVVSLQFSLQYFFASQDALDNLFNNITRVLKPGGAFCAVFPDGDSIRRVLLEDLETVSFRVRPFPKTKYLLLAPPSPPVGIPYTFALGGADDAGCPEYVISSVYLREVLEGRGFEIKTDARADDILASSGVKLGLSDREWKCLSLFRVIVATIPEQYQQ